MDSASVSEAGDLGSIPSARTTLRQTGSSGHAVCVIHVRAGANREFS